MKVKRFRSEPVVERELFDDALKSGYDSVAKATRYLDIIVQQNSGIADAIQLMETGRHLEARNALLRTRDAVAERL